MRKLLVAGLVTASVLLGYLLGSRTHSDEPRGKLLGHMVYFKLKDGSAKARAELVAGCKKYLSKHPGTVHFSAGVLAEDLKRDVNDRDFDVALQLVFENKAAHDRYQEHPDHQKFIDVYKSNWAKVRVFDAYVSP